MRRKTLFTDGMSDEDMYDPEDKSNTKYDFYISEFSTEAKMPKSLVQKIGEENIWDEVFNFVDYMYKKRFILIFQEKEVRFRALCLCSNDYENDSFRELITVNVSIQNITNQEICKILKSKYFKIIANKIHQEIKEFTVKLEEKFSINRKAFFEIHTSFGNNMLFKLDPCRDKVYKEKLKTLLNAEVSWFHKKQETLGKAYRFSKGIAEVYNSEKRVTYRYPINYLVPYKNNAERFIADN